MCCPCSFRNGGFMFIRYKLHSFIACKTICYLCYMSAPIRIIYIVAICLIVFPSILFAQNSAARKARWVDSVYNTLTEAERIGQLFMVAAYSGGRDYNEDAITQLVANHQVGGLIFMQGTPEAQAQQNNKYQRMANVPLLIGMDAEWGLGMRLTGVKDLPRQMMIGATMDTALAYRLGVAVAAQCKRLGVHINFAPVVDVNNNPKNPIINARSFGEDKEWVAKLGIAYMRGMQDNGVMACAKHFPGHGDANVDSHLDLPTLNHDLDRLRRVDWPPFQAVVDAEVASIMSAHILFPKLDAKRPATMSPEVMGLLRSELGYDGLVITDDLEMGAIAKHWGPRDRALLPLEAGCDVVLVCHTEDLQDEMLRVLEKAPDSLVEKSLERVLAFKKQWAMDALPALTQGPPYAEHQRLAEALGWESQAVKDPTAFR